MDRAEAKDILNYDIRQYIKQCEDATDEDFEALDLAIEALKKVSVYEQVKWERDWALKTLEEHGIGLGQKAETATTTDCISRYAVEEMIKAEMPERGMWEIEGDKEKETVCEVCVDLMQKLSELPPVEPPKKVVAQIKVDTDELIERIKEEYEIKDQPICEDAISKHDLWRIIEDNAYWVTYNETSKEKGMTLTGINQALNECPPVTSKVSEDCISRQAAIDALKGLPTWWADEGGYYGGAQAPMEALLDPEDAVSAIENLPSAQPEPLTDKEQRIFLAAMGREEKVCKQVDDERRDCREPYEDSLVRTCHEIVRKVKGALWT